MTLLLTVTTLVRRLVDAALLGLILVVLLSLAVARVVPAITGAPALVVGGGSMEPAVPLGSVVVDLPAAASDLHIGDVVSVKVGAQQAVFTHRIIRTVERDGAVWIETQGDANRTPDPTIIPAATVLGRVQMVLPYLGYPIQLLSSFAGVAFLLSVGLVSLLGAWLLETLEDDQRAWVRTRRLAAVNLVPTDVMPADRALPGPAG